MLTIILSRNPTLFIIYIQKYKKIAAQATLRLNKLGFALRSHILFSDAAKREAANFFKKIKDNYYKNEE